MKGRKPTPLALKVLRGQRVRSRAVDPAMIVSTPEKPRGLDQLESACWNSLVKDLSQRRLLHESMRGVLEVACSAYADWQRAVQACRKSLTYKTKSREGAVIFKQRPEVDIGNAAKRQYLSVLIELGLTPASASRCHPLPVEPKRARSGLASYFNDPLKPSA